MGKNNICLHCGWDCGPVFFLPILFRNFCDAKFVSSIYETRILDAYPSLKDSGRGDISLMF